jgi:prepilin-type N-terminal cleavage/methylation domain-containing protein
LSGEHGMTLTELLVAMVIGLFLIGGVVYAFVASFSSFRMNDNMARLQENGRFALDRLERDLRMVGHTGCARAVEGSLTFPASLENSLSSLEILASSSAAYGLEMAVAHDSILRLSGNASAANLASISVETVGSQPADLPTTLTGKPLLVGNCAKSEITRIESTANNETGGITIKAPLVNTYMVDDGQDVILYENTRYELSNDVLKRNGETLVDDVEVFKICASRSDGPGKSNDYQDAASASGKDIVSLQVDLLLRAPIAKGKDGAAAAIEEKFTLCDGKTVTRKDRHMRKLFSTTVALRNQFF